MKEYCPQCEEETATATYRRGDPQPLELPDTDMDMALGARDEMEFCAECGLDRDAEW